jgi:structure-specific endonuclease subunit SLX1
MDLKAIPAFYGCYLLRSTVRHSSLYVGSTPNPLRRLAQHNGRIKGGAVHTGRVSLRPWEMTCIVGGLPSNIAALQFEWAWTNSHLTRHISHAERISFATNLTKVSPRTGRTRRRPGRPRSSLTDKLSNLHLLLRSPYFSRLPLEVNFFCEDVYRVWQTWCERVDGQLPHHIKIRLDLKKAQDGAGTAAAGPPPKQQRRLDLVGSGGVEGVDTTYTALRPMLEKGQFVFDPDEQLDCDVCKSPLALDQDLIAICPHGACRSISHVECLAKLFLADGEDQADAVVPISGNCPSCAKRVQWVTLMKELSLRIRGAKEVRKILKKKPGAKVDISEDEDEDGFDDEADAMTADDTADESLDDVVSVTSMDSEFSTATTASVLQRGRPDATIEDSDDEIEILKM